ncbi:MAG: MiaB/RimO family radical SAM methylthiotransferase, partial [Chloroflexi bacterium]|nr:MiaB/RimO family radical SAM methylthiotransferase [Chloroflexota bacterium]
APRQGETPTTLLQAPVATAVPIALGCDHLCTYCIVRLRRGALQSRPMTEIAAEAAALVGQGVREITLLGQNVDAYGQDRTDAASLHALLRAIHPLEGLWRIRFLTSHPADLEDELIEAVAALPKVCPHFELPVQSGSDAVLRRMVRRYRVADYRRLAQRIRQRVPGASIATDVIVGFPGETAEQFAETAALLEELRFDAVHVAAYSPRPGTAAFRLPDDVPPEEKERRRQAVEEIQERVVGEINQALLGQTVEVLVEGRRKGRWWGRTVTNKLVFFPDDRPRYGDRVAVRVEWAGPWSMLGQPVD